MQSFLSIYLVIFCALSSGFLPLHGQEIDCSQILQHGIYDTSSSISENERASSFVSWLKRNTFASYNDAKKYGAQVGVPIDGLLVSLGFTSDEKGYSEFKEAIDWYQEQNQSFKSKLQSYISTINPNVIAAWDHCVNSSGVHFWIVQKADPSVFILAARYLSDGGNIPSLVDVQFLPTDQVKIEPGMFYKRRWFGRVKVDRRKIDGNVISQAFTRKKAGPLTIVVNSTRGPGLQTQLPDAFPKPKPSIRDFVVSPDNIVNGDTAIISWNVLGSDSVLINNGLGNVANSGKIEIKPRQTTSYKLTAINPAGETEKVTTLTVLPKVLIQQVIVRFRTECDDKDDDTTVRIAIKKSNGQVIASGDQFHGSHFDDGPPSEKECTLNVNSEVRKDEMGTGILSVQTLNTGGAGNDKWCFRPKVTLILSDGTTRGTDFLVPSCDCLETHNHQWTGEKSYTFRF